MDWEETIDLSSIYGTFKPFIKLIEQSRNDMSKLYAIWAIWNMCVESKYITIETRNLPCSYMNNQS